MKTITEYQPMIYSALFAQPERRRQRQQQRLRITGASLLACYFGASVIIMGDTGFAAWNWQFWVMFLPLFALGEQVLRTLARTR